MPETPCGAPAGGLMMAAAGDPLVRGRTGNVMRVTVHMLICCAAAVAAATVAGCCCLFPGMADSLDPYLFGYTLTRPAEKDLAGRYVGRLNEFAQGRKEYAGITGPHVIQLNEDGTCEVENIPQESRDTPLSGRGRWRVVYNEQHRMWKVQLDIDTPGKEKQVLQVLQFDILGHWFTYRFLDVWDADSYAGMMYDPQPDHWSACCVLL